MKHKKAVKKKNKAGSVKFKSHSYAKHVKLRTKSAAKAQKNTTQKSAAQKNAVTSSAASSLAFDANIKPSQPSSPVRFNIPGRQLNKPHKLRIGIDRKSVV